MKIELLRCLLDKGTINDESVIYVSLPCSEGGSDHIVPISGISIEQDSVTGNSVVVLNAALPGQFEGH